MKTLLVLLLLILALLGSVQAQTQSPSPTPFPNLEGTWTGTGEGIRMDGSTEKLNLNMVVDRQVGQLFVGALQVDQLGAEGQVVNQEKLLFTGHLAGDLRIAMTLTPWPPPSEEPAGPAPTTALMNGTWAADTISGVWENLTFGNTGWATLKKQ